MPRTATRKTSTTATRKKAVAKTASPAKAKASSEATEASDTTTTEGASAKEDAITLLKADHREVEKLFAQYQATESDDDKTRLTQQICRALSIHARLEDEIFYAACREHDVDTDLMDEAQVEHDGAGVLIEELMASTPDAPFHDAKVKVLSEYIQMHVREEEKPSSGIFAKAKSAGLDMSELGQRIKSRKQEFETQAQSRDIRPPTPRSLGNETQDDNGERNMARFNQERDEQGRFVSDDDRRSSGRDRDDDRRYGRSGDDDRGRSSMRNDRDDDRGRYSRSRDDDDDRGGRSGGGNQYQQRDDEGRFTSSRGGRDDDDRGGRSGGGSQYRQRDDEGRFTSSRGGRDDDDRGRYSSRSRDDDDRSRSGSRGRDDDRGHGGWFGDSEGHSRAAQRGWDNRRDDDDDRGSYSRSRSDDNRSRSSSDDDRGGRSSSSRGGRDDDRGHGGWFGDSEGHARAAERGWETRREDDRSSGGGSRSRGGR
ncbi:MAG: hemerythrin domain-containing protein [Lysobacteraceae bacterium]